VKRRCPGGHFLSVGVEITTITIIISSSSININFARYLQRRRLLLLLLLRAKCAMLPPSAAKIDPETKPEVGQQGGLRTQEAGVSVVRSTAGRTD